MIKNILKFSVSNIVNIILGLLAAFVLTRVFDPEVYGILNIFNTTTATLLSVFYIGLDTCFIRFYNEPPVGNTNRQFGTKLLLLSLSIELVCGFVVSVLFYGLLTKKVFGFCSQMICVLLFTSVFSQIILRFLNIKYRMEFNARAYTIQAILVQVALKLFVVIAALMSLRIENVLLVNVFGITLLAIVSLIIQRKSFFSFKDIGSFKGYGGVLLFALFSAPLSIIINLNTFLSQQLITREFGTAGVGIYSSAGYFAGILAAVQGGFATYWAAYMYANYSTKQEEIKKVNEYLLTGCIFVFSALVLGKDIVYLLIGIEYYESQEFFSLVLCYPILLLASETTAYGITIKKKNYLSLVSFGVSILLNLLLTYLLLPVLGLKGAAVGSMVSGVVLYLMLTYFGQKYYRSISDKLITIEDVLIIIAMSIVPSFTSGGLLYILVLLLLGIGGYVNRRQILTILRKCQTLIRK